MKWPFWVQLLAAIWVCWVAMLLIRIPSWTTVMVIFNLSVPPFIIGRQMILDAWKRAMQVAFGKDDHEA